MKKALIGLFLLGWAINAGAQTSSSNDELKLEADYYLVLKEYDRALDMYLRVIKSEPDNADIKHRIGICYLNSEQDKPKAIPYLEEAVEKVSVKYNPNSFKETNTSYEAWFTLGSAYRVNNELDKAIEAYKNYKSYLDDGDEYNNSVVGQYIRSCETAREMQQRPVNVTMINAGNRVNNEKPNYNAVVSGDGRTMLYTSPARQGYDIMMTTLSDSGWTTPKNITSILGTGKYMKTCDLSHDGTTLLLALDDPEKADIFISRFNKGRWSKVEPLGKNINSNSNETHACISADGKTLYFTSNRKGGFGDMDIYRSVLDEKGEWGKAVNMDAAINTELNEETPFLSDDETILYFSSEGHNGMGGYDIYRINPEQQGAEAVNMGYPLNTTDNNLFFSPAGDNMTAYYAVAGGDSYGARDIYLVTVSEPEPEPQYIPEIEPEVVLADIQPEAVRG